MNRLLPKETAWKWSEEEQKCFATTKEMIVGADVLVHYDPGKPWYYSVAQPLTELKQSSPITWMLKAAVR